MVSEHFSITEVSDFAIIALTAVVDLLTKKKIVPVVLRHRKARDVDLSSKCHETN